MSEQRPHLSIGEVLSLLQDEFPDITISKIRFLESQGLLNPERTPSGYRKFYGHDVEQLRWVLRQQKENFLPLKVIKDRLAAGQLDAPASASGLLDLVPVDDHDRPGPAAGDRAEDRAATNGGPVRPVAAVGADRPESAGEASAARSPAPRAEVPSPPQRHRPTAPVPSPPPPVARDEVVAAAADLGSSVSLGADELCAATGASPQLLAELERYGLVSGRTLGADTVYDDDAMLVCRLAASMAAAGIEARHLRMFKVAAEREAGLYEQLAMPRIRTQRPEARSEAVAEVVALTATAADLHAALLRRALRDTLGPL